MFEKIEWLIPKSDTPQILKKGFVGDQLVVTNWSMAESGMTIAIGKIPVSILERSATRKIQGKFARAMLNQCLREKYPAIGEQYWKVTAPQLGRPRLSGPVNLDVSFSHRLSWVACAISSGHRIGIDVEPIPREFDEYGLELFLSSVEIDWVQQKPQEDRDVSAIVLWCLKEAWLKASNMAGAVAMNQIIFSSNLELLSANAEPQIGKWQFMAWKVDADLIVTVCSGNKEDVKPSLHS